MNVKTIIIGTGIFAVGFVAGKIYSDYKNAEVFDEEDLDEEIESNDEEQEEVVEKEVKTPRGKVVNISVGDKKPNVVVSDEEADIDSSNNVVLLGKHVYPIDEEQYSQENLHFDKLEWCRYTDVLLGDMDEEVSNDIMFRILPDSEMIKIIENGLAEVVAYDDPDYTALVMFRNEQMLVDVCVNIFGVPHND